jgi:membrane-associated phospholipid phosphatase
MVFLKHYSADELAAIRFRGALVTPSPDRSFVIRPEEDVGGVFFLLLVAMSIGHGSRLFEPIRSSRLTYMTTQVFVALLLVVGVWALLQRFALHRTEDAGHSLSTVGRVLRDWLPAIICLGIYESLKHLHLNEIILWLGNQPKDRLMIRIDEVMFGGHASVWLQHAISPTMTWYMKTVYYVGYYLYPALIGMFLYLFRPRVAFRELVLAFLATAFIGYTCYILVPVAGPRFELKHLYDVTFIATSELQRMQEQHRFDYDCFPSLHTAMPLVGLAICLRHSRLLAALLVPFVLSTVVSTLYLQMHYLIDVVAGIVLVPLTVLLAIRADGAWERLHQRTAPPVTAGRPRFGWVARVIQVLLALVALAWLTSLVV